MVSGLFRGIIWNYVVPNSMRGRLAGIAMISYMSGPLLGNVRAGWIASLSSVSVSMWSGGIACVIAVVATSVALPKFWNYRPEPAAPAQLASGELSDRQSDQYRGPLCIDARELAQRTLHDVTDDFTALTGIAPLPLQQWLAANKPVLNGFAA